MRNPTLAIKPSAKQGGASLIVVLIMLSAIFILVAFGSRLTLLGEKSARNDRDRQIAFQAAEAALSDAEIDIMGPNSATNSRVCDVHSRKVDLFTDGCGNTTLDRGLCATNTSATDPLFKSIDFEDTSNTRRYASLGDFTGRNVGFQPAIVRCPHSCHGTSSRPSPSTSQAAPPTPKRFW
jgi:type IV pilus assembly protein PilX